MWVSWGLYYQRSVWALSTASCVLCHASCAGEEGGGYASGGSEGRGGTGGGGTSRDGLGGTYAGRVGRLMRRGRIISTLLPVTASISRSLIHLYLAVRNSSRLPLLSSVGRRRRPCKKLWNWLLHKKQNEGRDSQEAWSGKGTGRYSGSAPSVSALASFCLVSLR